MSLAPRAGRRAFEAPCTIEIEHTADSLHAHVDIEGIEPEPGDVVVVHAPPTHVPFGEKVVVRRTATVYRAGPVQRAWTKLLAYLELTELYEVGFSEGSKP